MHQRSILRRGNGLPPRPLHQTSLALDRRVPASHPTALACRNRTIPHAPAGITHRVRFSDVPGAVDKGLEAVLRRTGPESAGRLLHVCSDVAVRPGSGRYRAAADHEGCRTVRQVVALSDTRRYLRTLWAADS